MGVNYVKTPQLDHLYCTLLSCFMTLPLAVQVSSVRYDKHYFPLVRTYFSILSGFLVMLRAISVSVFLFSLLDWKYKRGNG